MGNRAESNKNKKISLRRHIFTYASLYILCKQHLPCNGKVAKINLHLQLIVKGYFLKHWLECSSVLVGPLDMCWQMHLISHGRACLAQCEKGCKAMQRIRGQEFHNQLVQFVVSTGKRNVNMYLLLCNKLPQHLRA